MKFETVNIQNNCGTGGVGIFTTPGHESLVNPVSENPAAEYESYAHVVLTEISRIKNVSREQARQFVDFSTFNEIVQCLRDGLSSMAELEFGVLALTFCHISTTLSQTD